jgi:hypothetical protein
MHRSFWDIAIFYMQVVCCRCIEGGSAGPESEIIGDTKHISLPIKLQSHHFPQRFDSRVYWNATSESCDSYSLCYMSTFSPPDVCRYSQICSYWLYCQFGTLKIVLWFEITCLHMFVMWWKYFNSWALRQGLASEHMAFEVKCLHVFTIETIYLCACTKQTYKKIVTRDDQCVDLKDLMRKSFTLLEEFLSSGYIM